MHSHADGLSRMTYEPTEVPAPDVTEALMVDNFVNSVDLWMRESEFNSWLVQLANENKVSCRFVGELLHDTATIEVDDEEQLNMYICPDNRVAVVFTQPVVLLMSQVRTSVKRYYQ